jgi:hypothetical protein
MEDRKLQGIGLYFDKQRAILCCSVIVHGNNKSFEARLKEKPYQAEQGGWIGLFDNLDPLIGLAFNLNADNSILTDHKNGVLVWNDHTIEKLKQSNITGTLEDKQMKLV